jgi:hypothetical protein
MRFGPDDSPTGGEELLVVRAHGEGGAPLRWPT